MKRIRVTGYMDIEDHDYDPGPNGPLTEGYWKAFMQSNVYLDDVEMELVEDD